MGSNRANRHYMKNFHVNKILISLGLGLGLFILLYFASERRAVISSECSTLKWVYNIYHKFAAYDTVIPNDYLLVNVSYDRALVAYTDADGDTLGMVDVADRQKLLDFLQMARRGNVYKHIIIDLDFGGAFRSDVDGELWDVMADMPRLTIARLRNDSLPDERLREKSALADFYFTIGDDDFTKYDYINGDGRESVAWKVYSEMEGVRYYRGARIFLSKGRLMRKAFVPDIQYVSTTTEDDATREQQSMLMESTLNLGADLLQFPELGDEVIKDKIVIVGNYFLSDQHQCYRGSIPGPLIHLNALENLRNEKHLISWFAAVLMWLFLSFLFWLVIDPPRLMRVIETKSPVDKLAQNSKIWNAVRVLYHLLLSFFSFSTLLYVAFFFFFMVYDQIYEVMVLGLVFSLLSQSYHLGNARKER